MSAYQPAKRHPLTLPLIIAGHGAVLAALALSKMEVPIIEQFGPTYTKNIPLPKDPPPPPPADTRPKDQPSQTPSVPDSTRTPVPLPDNLAAPPAPADPPPPIPIPEVPFADRTVLPPPAPIPAPPQPAPTPDPVRIEAARDPHYADDFQPPYPDTMQARGEEGSAVVRVLIGANGRVSQVEPVSATNPAFMSATTRHARARWRFRPATLDGKPVESWKRITVTFTLND